MGIEETQAAVLAALEKATTSEGETIYDRFTALQVGEIVTQIVYALPISTDNLIDVIKARVLDALQGVEITWHTNLCITNLLKKQLLHKSSKEQEALLLFYLLLRYKETNDDTIYSALDGVEDYFNSLLIESAEDVVIEVQAEPKQGMTIPHNGRFIRRDILSFDLIPTVETRLNYNNYLITKKEQ